jgi:hypothetical protein
MSLATIKNIMAPLLAELDLCRPGNHCPCCFCGSSDGMSVQMGDSGAYFRCHACGARGDIVTAVVMRENIRPIEAIRRLTGEEYRPPNRPSFTERKMVEPEVPVPDIDKLNYVFELAIANVIEGKADEAIRRRGLSKDWLIHCPNLGYFPHDQAWCFRVTLPNGEAVALKIHRDRPLEGQPKSQWLRMGTAPSDHPRHGFATLWPPVEWHPSGELFIAEGELKAAALLSAGFSATAPTTGAGFKWTPGIIARMAGRHVVIVFDQDDAGNKFRINTINALTGAVKSINEITFTESDLERNML